MWPFENSYIEQLPEQLYSLQNPEPADYPEIVYFNDELAKSLGINQLTEDREMVRQVLSGAQVPEGTKSIAQAYAGHQFGNFTMLGDGRAVLLGELVTDGKRFDLQLKGSGQTKFSRRGDGRATLASMLREYLMSESMHFLGIPTTRSLAVVKTGLPVYRESVNDGAVLTRIAASHIRVGTFEYARFFAKPEHLSVLTDYVIARHYPDLAETNDKVLKFFSAVMERQIDLIVNWMRVGFIHGVMNTDNMSIAGETIDYGPCAFMNAYHPDTVFSSIDQNSRYAFKNQPRIAHWNLSVLANALLPLIDEKQEVAVEKVTEILDTFPGKFSSRNLEMMRHKLGIVHADESDKSLIGDLLPLLANNQIDYTNFFTELRKDQISSKSLLENDQFISWKQRWQAAHSRKEDELESLKLMERHNPVVIPRNHLVENALDSAVNGDYSTFDALLKDMQSPYGNRPEMQLVPAGFDQRYQTFCGT
ncbi:MAG: YdiU family protein [Bacteroidota bacterium]